MLSYIPSWIDGTTTLLQKLNRCIEKIENIDKETKAEVNEIKEEINVILTEIDSLQGIIETMQDDIQNKQDKLYLHRIKGTFSLTGAGNQPMNCTLYFLCNNNENIASEINLYYKNFISGIMDGSIIDRSFQGTFIDFGTIPHLNYFSNHTTAGFIMINNEAENIETFRFTTEIIMEI